MDKVGKKIKMTGETQRYTVMACNNRFAVLTKPFNAKKTYLYCITDVQSGIRGPCNYLFGPPTDAELNTQEGAAEAMLMLESGEMRVSHRRNKKLDADEIAQLSEDTK